MINATDPKSENRHLSAIARAYRTHAGDVVLSRSPDTKPRRGPSEYRSPTYRTRDALAICVP